MKALILCLVLGQFKAFAQQGHAPIQMPSLHANERAAFNWSPSYTVNLPAFSSTNHAFFRGRSENPHEVPPFVLEHFNRSGLRKRPYGSAILKHFPAGTIIKSTIGGSGRRNTSGVFNLADEYFTLMGVVVQAPLAATTERAWILLWTADTGATWSSYLVARESEFVKHRCPSRYNYTGTCEFPSDVEISRNFSPAAISGNMPAILMHYRTGRVGLRATDRFDQIGPLSLMIVTRNSRGVKTHRYLPLSSSVLGIGAHSGGSARVVRYRNRIYVTWIEGTRSLTAGSPTVVALYDISTRTFSKKIVAHTYPANDSHNQPGMTMTSTGVLHIISGAHGGVMKHTYSLSRESISSWSEPQTMGSTDEQTYISLIADSRDNLHAVYRRWISTKLGVLAYQKFDGQGWSPPKNLVYPNMYGYFIYYQHLTVDRRDNLYLTYSRWSLHPGYANVPQFSRTAMLKSSDGGHQWHLATDSDIIREQAPRRPLK